MKHQCNIDVAEISALKTSMIFSFCIEIINVTSIMHRRLFNEQTCFSLTTAMIHQCSQCILEWENFAANPPRNYRNSEDTLPHSRKKQEIKATIHSHVLVISA